VKRHRISVIVWLAALALAACGPRQPADSQSTAPPAARGSIRGVARVTGDLPPASLEPIRQNADVCGDSHALPHMGVTADRRLQHAFVYLDGVEEKGDLRPRESLLVDQKRCEYFPHVRAVPAGTQLEISNSDPILHNVHARRVTTEGLQTIFNIAQPMRGMRTPVEQRLDKPGVVVLTCEAGHPWMRAYLLVMDHPYVATTNEAGEFVIPDVPPGTYQITMWHEGIRLKRVLRALQRYEYEDPYEITRQVVVEPGKETVVDFELALRGAS
jgi:hypothetical protein